MPHSISGEAVAFLAGRITSMTYCMERDKPGLKIEAHIGCSFQGPTETLSLLVRAPSRVREFIGCGVHLAWPGLENTTGDGKETIERKLSLCIPLTRLTSTAYIPSIAVSNYSQSPPEVRRQPQ
jgi:hypothetical protein